MSYQTNALVFFQHTHHGMEPDVITFIGGFPEDGEVLHYVYELQVLGDEEADIETETAYISIDINKGSLVTRYVDEEELKIIKTVQALEDQEPPDN